jgi:hypothetical protein
MKVKEDDVIGVCCECKSDQDDGSMYRSVFAQSGLPPVCKYCGGKVIIVYRSQRESALDQIDRERGL